MPAIARTILFASITSAVVGCSHPDGPDVGAIEDSMERAMNVVNGIEAELLSFRVYQCVALEDQYDRWTCDVGWTSEVTIEGHPETIRDTRREAIPFTLSQTDDGEDFWDIDMDRFF